jgi:hypothetical protein
MVGRDIMKSGNTHIEEAYMCAMLKEYTYEEIKRAESKIGPPERHYNHIPL